MGLLVRIFITASALMLLLAPSAAAQTLGVQGSAGATLVDAGYNFSAAVVFAPSDRVSIALGYDHTHIESRTRTTGIETSSFRGGTLYLGSAEVKVTLFRRNRAGPYGLAGLAAGWARPNVNAVFPDRITNDARAILVGGGVHVPVGERASVFADARMIFGSEGRNGTLAVAPVRIGMSWTF